ncbi:MAG: GNAT family N-acetyltransferase [Spirulinaceae cyanobacterium]
MEKVIFAKAQDLEWIKSLIDKHRKEFSFVNRAILLKGIDNQKILCIRNKGFLHFHHRLDSKSTLYHLCVLPEERRTGLGKLLVSVWEDNARKYGVRLLQLKCPIDLEANEFYKKVGFQQVDIKEGKNRTLVVWNKQLTVKRKTNKTQFVASLSAEPWKLNKLRRLWEQSDDRRNPFEYIIYSPITCPFSTTKYYKNEKELSSSSNNHTQYPKKVWFDCGAYQVQQGRYSYSELLDFLSNFYINNQWADGYVLPDIPPVSTDSKKLVEEKVQKTVFHCLDFFNTMPDYIQERAIAPVVGKTLKQINYCIESYKKLGIKYIGFGSWGTSGKNKSVNLLGRDSLSLFGSLLLMAEQYEMKVHCFGIGGTSSLKRLQQENLLPDSLDSTTWWKSAGYGNIFFPNHPQIQITVKDMTDKEFEDIKLKTEHSCFFCKNMQDLKDNRNYRIMHNLSAWLDALERL